MDEKTIKIVASRLKKFEGQPMNQERLSEIREAVFKGTGANKSASFANVKKWVKAARSFMKKAESQPQKHKVASKQAHAKEAPKAAREPAVQEVPRRVEESVNFIKDEAVVPAPFQEVAMQRPTVVFDKVYLQSIKFEVASIRQVMERVSRQLDKLEKELSSHHSDE